MTTRNSGDINRRGFIKTSALFAVAVSIHGLNGCKDETDGTGKNPPVDDCITTDDILGPYYKADAPFQEDIIPGGTAAPPLIIDGKVFSHCNTLLENAVVEIWNANADGAYDMSEEFLFRGQYQTGSDGVYRFKTIIPGRYLNGSLYRPSHIHFRITAPGHRELVSQIYFKEDPFIDTDPWAGTPKAQERILAVTTDVNGTDTVTFDIHLREV